VTKSEIVRAATLKFLAEVDRLGIAGYTNEMFTV
jgi:hypothetical protein